MSQPADNPVLASLDTIPAPSDSPPPSFRHLTDRLPWAATWVLLLSLSAVVNALLIAATHGTRGFFLPALATCVCLLAALFDAWTHRIPNPLTYTAALLGLGLNLMAPLLETVHAHAAVVWLGAVGPGASLLGLGVCAGIPLLLLPLVWAVFGRDSLNLGDLKVMAAVGVSLGLINTASVAIVALGVALVYAAVNLAVMGRLNSVLSAGAHRLLELFYLRRLMTPLPGEAVTAASHIPMAVPLALGTAAWCYWQIHALHAGGTL